MTTKRDGIEAQAFLPLRPSWLHILVAVAGGQQHGYAIRREVERRTEGRVRLWPATLYGALSQLLENGLLEEVESDVAAAEDDDPRRIYYGLTGLGRRVLEAETVRLDELLRAARSGLAAQRSGGR